jgi:hypothetical protein
LAVELFQLPTTLSSLPEPKRPIIAKPIKRKKESNSIVRKQKDARKVISFLRADEEMENSPPLFDSSPPARPPSPNIKKQHKGAKKICNNQLTPTRGRQPLRRRKLQFTSDEEGDNEPVRRKLFISSDEESDKENDSPLVLYMGPKQPWKVVTPQKSKVSPQKMVTPERVAELLTSMKAFFHPSPKVVASTPIPPPPSPNNEIESDLIEVDHEEIVEGQSHSQDEVESQISDEGKVFHLERDEEIPEHSQTREQENKIIVSESQMQDKIPLEQLGEGPHLPHNELDRLGESEGNEVLDGMIHMLDEEGDELLGTIDEEALRRGTSDLEVCTGEIAPAYIKYAWSFFYPSDFVASNEPNGEPSQKTLALQKSMVNGLKNFTLSGTKKIYVGPIQDNGNVGFSLSETEGMYRYNIITGNLIELEQLIGKLTECLHLGARKQCKILFTREKNKIRILKREHKAIIRNLYLEKRNASKEVQECIKNQLKTQKTGLDQYERELKAVEEREMLVQRTIEFNVKERDIIQVWPHLLRLDLDIDTRYAT